MTFRAPLLIAKSALTMASALLDRNGLGFNSETKGAIPRPRQTTFFWGFICQTYERNDLPQPEFAGFEPLRIAAPRGASSRAWGRLASAFLPLLAGIGGACGDRSLISRPSMKNRGAVRAGFKATLEKDEQPKGAAA